jgi:hypothetical protein
LRLQSHSSELSMGWCGKGSLGPLDEGLVCHRV